MPGEGTIDIDLFLRRAVSPGWAALSADVLAERLSAVELITDEHLRLDVEKGHKPPRFWAHKNYKSSTNHSLIHFKIEGVFRGIKFANRSKTLLVGSSHPFPLPSGYAVAGAQLPMGWQGPERKESGLSVPTVEGGQQRLLG